MRLPNYTRSIGTLLLLLPNMPLDLPAQALPEKPAWLVRRADLYLATRERWRGIRRNAFPLIEAATFAGVKLRAVSLAAGVWGAVEPGDTREEPRLDLRAGTPGFSTVTGWAQAAASTGRLTGSVGVTRDWYRRVGSDPAVTELYGVGRWHRNRWTASLSAWHAVSGAEGTYLEPTVGFHHFVNPLAGPVVSWTTTLRAGFQLSEREPDGGLKVPGPEGTGLTHVGLGSSFRVATEIRSRLALLLSFGPEFQGGRDAAVRRRRDGSRASWLGFWIPFQIGFSYPLARPE